MGIYKDKGSKFVSIALPVNSEVEIRKQLAEIKNEFHDARHYCYAFILGPEKATFRFSDDGEPSGTAGRSIYGQIRSKGLTDILVVVVRYFGGIKLGVRGLINAYRSATQIALESAREIEKTVSFVYEVKFDYALMDKVMRLAKDESLHIIHQNFNLSCSLQFFIRRTQSDRILEKFETIKGCEINYKSMISS